jgi:hypothetical protein
MMHKSVYFAPLYIVAPSIQLQQWKYDEGIMRSGTIAGSVSSIRTVFWKMGDDHGIKEAESGEGFGTRLNTE